MHTFTVAQVAVLALVASVSAAPAPLPHFPLIAFHGVPEARPTAFPLTTSVPYHAREAAPHVEPAAERNNVHRKRDLISTLESEFIKFNQEQLEALLNALQHDLPLPSLNLTYAATHQDRPTLLAAVESFLDHQRGHSHKRGVVQSSHPMLPVNVSSLPTTSKALSSEPTTFTTSSRPSNDAAMEASMQDSISAAFLAMVVSMDNAHSAHKLASFESKIGAVVAAATPKSGTQATPTGSAMIAGTPVSFPLPSTTAA